MDDLISRQAAIDAIGEIHPLDYNAQAIAERIKELPPAQPEVIRCKDCRWWIPGYITDRDDFIPPKCGKYQQMVGHSANDFCNFAEWDKNECR